MVYRLFNKSIAALCLAMLALSFQNCDKGFKVLDDFTSFSSTTSLGSAMNCSPTFAPERVPLRLLSNLEYDFIAADVLLSKRKPSADAKFDIPALGSSGFSNTSMTSEASTPTISDMTMEKYWTAAGALADEVIANKAQSGSAYSSLAACALNVSTVSETCYASIARSLALKLWRRPLSETAPNNELSRLVALLKGGASFEGGFHDLIKALLISPYFLVVSFN
ncbi:MAG TPA: hypothetical protein VIG33_04205, partial [Pseudobdellovibrionaceae bacterium]